MSYDVKCYQLAERFIGDAPESYSDVTKAKLTDKLAQAIQTAIEDFLQEHGL